MSITYNRMVDSPVGSLLGCYVFNGCLTKEKAVKLFTDAEKKGNLPTPDDINEAFVEWKKYFKLPEKDGIMAFRNQYTFRFAPFIKNDSGEFGFFPLQDNGIYTYFEKTWVNTNNAVILDSAANTNNIEQTKKKRVSKSAKTKKTGDKE